MSNLNRYHSYLLRIWCVSDGGRENWRASLEDPHTRKVIAFSSREALCDFLLRLDGEAPGAATGSHAAPPGAADIDHDPTDIQEQST